MGTDKLSLFPMFPTKKFPSRLRKKGKQENKTQSSKKRNFRHKNKKTSPSGIPKPSPTGKIASVVKCSRVNCATCPVFHPSKYFKNTLTSRKYQVVGNCNLSCSTSNLVYLITCSKCDNQYVGETKEKLSKRLSGHRSAIKKHANTFIAKLLNQPGHSVADILIQPIEKSSYFQANQMKVSPSDVWIENVFGC